MPGALWFQYTAGLTPNDYASQWSFITQAILAKTAATALARIQTSVNLGQIEQQTQVDGLSYKVRYSEKGVFSGAIADYEKEAKSLTREAKTKVSGPMMGSL